jgi:hypothetical protein
MKLKKEIKASDFIWQLERAIPSEEYEGHLVVLTPLGEFVFQESCKEELIKRTKSLFVKHQATYKDKNCLCHHYQKFVYANSDLTNTDYERLKLLIEAKIDYNEKHYTQSCYAEIWKGIPRQVWEDFPKTAYDILINNRNLFIKR